MSDPDAPKPKADADGFAHPSTYRIEPYQETDASKPGPPERANLKWAPRLKMLHGPTEAGDGVDYVRSDVHERVVAENERLRAELDAARLDPEDAAVASDVAELDAEIARLRAQLAAVTERDWEELRREGAQACHKGVREFEGWLRATFGGGK